MIEHVFHDGGRAAAGFKGQRIFNLVAEEDRAWLGFYRRVGHDVALATEVLAQWDASARAAGWPADWRLSDDAQFPDLDAWGISEGWWSELQEGLMGPSYEAAIPDWIKDVYFDYYPTIDQLSTLYKGVDWEYYNANNKEWYDKWLQGIGL